MIASPLHAVHSKLGARFGTFAGSELPRDYGDPTAEYASVRNDVGLVDRADQAQVWMRGRDPIKMLHGLISNDLLAAPAGHAVYATMLTPKGRVIAEMRALTRVTPEGPEVLIDLPREALAGTVEHLRKFVPPMFARWSIAEDLTSIGVYGPRAETLLTRLAEGFSALQEDQFLDLRLGDGSAIVVGTRYAGGESGYDLLVDASDAPALWTRLLEIGGDLGVRPVGQAVLDTLRIEAGRPRYGSELTAETIPTEAFESTGLMERAISFTKGCYTGQEVIVRIAHRGHVNRHLRGIRLGEGVAPEPGTRLFRADPERDVGWVTRATYSPLLGETIAMGYLRREISPGDRIRVGAPDGAEATVSVLPFARED